MTVSSRVRSNSSNSLYVSGTIENHDADEAIKNIAYVIESMIDVFNIPRPGCPLCRSEAKCPPPSYLDIQKFITTLYGIGSWTQECNLLAMVLILRMVAAGHYALNAQNWDMVFFAGVLIAQKNWDDVPLPNSEFYKMLQILNIAFGDGRYDKISMKRLNNMEVQFVMSINYEIFVHYTVYSQFYFEIMSLSAAVEEEQNGKEMELCFEKQGPLKTVEPMEIEVLPVFTNALPSASRCPSTPCGMKPVPRRRVCGKSGSSRALQVLDGASLPTGWESVTVENNQYADNSLKVAGAPPGNASTITSIGLVNGQILPTMQLQAQTC
jgi:hypothetical protein